MTPRFLLGAALLWWGWRTGHYFTGALLAVLAEAPRLLRPRYVLGDDDFRRIATLCTIIFVALLAWLFASAEGARTSYAVLTTLTWLPAVLMPLLLAQQLSSAGRVPLSAMFRYVRKLKQRLPSTPDPAVDLLPIYFAVCLVASSIPNRRDALFYAGAALLVAWALAEAAKLERAGLDACIVENVGDVPLFRDSVPPVTTAAMAVLVHEVRRATAMKVGVNMLRNACAEALSVAHVCGADFIRCNVVIGAYVTDQGIIQGCAAELARLRRALDSDVAILGDVHVKHAHPLFDVAIEYAAQDLAERGGVDAVIVSGPRSPIPMRQNQRYEVESAKWNASCS